jgi:hypothetical protein
MKKARSAVKTEVEDGIGKVPALDPLLQVVVELCTGGHVTADIGNLGIP